LCYSALHASPTKSTDLDVFFDALFAFNKRDGRMAFMVFFPASLADEQLLMAIGVEAYLIDGLLIVPLAIHRGCIFFFFLD
jgi:hypothetical protein